VLKFFLCTKPDPEAGTGAVVHMTFPQALEAIRKIDRLTLGIPKIVYLVGWQYDGHDSGYPAWGSVNERLKRREDPDAATSLRWLMEAAGAYHTTVSVHVNMNDAYSGSPDWQLYVEKDALARAEGRYVPGGKWGGEQAFYVDLAREWETGLARRRIDALLNLMPLREAGTVHIDAFFVVESPDHGNGTAEQQEAMRRTFRYFRDHGVDVTSEMAWHLRGGEAFIGLQPMAWHLNNPHWNAADEMPASRYMEVPAWLLCGGVDHGITGQLFGTSMHGEGLVLHDPEGLSGFLPRFCSRVVPWYFLNRRRRESVGYDRDRRPVEARFSDGVEVSLRDGTRTIRQHGLLRVHGEDVFLPAEWLGPDHWIAFSARGYESREWQFPSRLADQSVSVQPITIGGLGKGTTADVSGGVLRLTLAANAAVLVRTGR
jgi:hypothetical protein